MLLAACFLAFDVGAHGSTPARRAEDTLYSSKNTDANNQVAFDQRVARASSGSGVDATTTVSAATTCSTACKDHPHTTGRGSRRNAQTKAALDTTQPKPNLLLIVSDDQG